MVSYIKTFSYKATNIVNPYCFNIYRTCLHERSFAKLKKIKSKYENLKRICFFDRKTAEDAPMVILIEEQSKNCTRDVNYKLSGHDWRKGLSTILSLSNCRLNSSFKRTFHVGREGCTFWKMRFISLFPQGKTLCTKRILLMLNHIMKVHWCIP